MSEATIAGEIATALEPAAAQLLEDLHGEVSGELERIEAAMPATLETAESKVKEWAEDMFTTFHKVVASIDAKRAGASTKTAQAEQLPAGQTAQPTGPAVSAPATTPAKPTA